MDWNRVTLWGCKPKTAKIPSRELDLLNDRMQVDDDLSAAMESVPLNYTRKFNRLNVERVIDYRVSISTFLGITCSAAAKIPLTWRPYSPASSQRNTLNYKGDGIFGGLGLEPQKDALTQAGCTKIYTDTASGAKEERVGLQDAIEYVREGDILVVWRLDRLGRSLKHLIETITELNNRNIGFKSLTENIDTTTSGGKLVFHIFGALAEFERDIIRERTQAGLQAARARGRKGGRPKALNTPKKITMAQTLYNDKSNTIDEICRTLNISRATLYRYIKTGEGNTQIP